MEEGDDDLWDALIHLSISNPSKFIDLFFFSLSHTKYLCYTPISNFNFYYEVVVKLDQVCILPKVQNKTS